MLGELVANLDKDPQPSFFFQLQATIMLATISSCMKYKIQNIETIPKKIHLSHSYATI